MIAERCLEEDVATFRDSIQTIVDQVEVGRGEGERWGGSGGRGSRHLLCRVAGLLLWHCCCCCRCM